MLRPSYKKISTMSRNQTGTQSTLVISKSLISNTAYLKVKIWSMFKHLNLISGKKILWKREEIAPKEQFLLLFSTMFSLYL